MAVPDEMDVRLVSKPRPKDGGNGDDQDVECMISLSIS